MANITFNNKTTGYSMWLDEVEPQVAARAPDYLYISTPNKYSILFEGGLFTYSTAGAPLSGNVERIGVVFPTTNATDKSDIEITDLNVDLGAYAGLFMNSGPEKTTAFWKATLSGNDTIDFGTTATEAGFSINFAGDGNVAQAAAVGANDYMHGDVGKGIATGDFFLVQLGQTAFGGNDDMRIADSYDSTIVGDFHVGETYASLFAGDDIIRLGDQGATVYGDVAYLDGSLEAGDDTIIGSSRDDLLIGDVGVAYDTAVFRSGDDEIHGGAGNDDIYGDAGYTSYATFIGGDDRLYGDAGTDSISGGAGNDSLFGGADSDYLQGGVGNDMLHGGAGGDRIYGGSGVDTVDYRDVAKKVQVALTVYGGGQVEVGGGFDDYLDGIENILGGKAGDKFIGNATQGDNLFEGRAGNDTLNGAFGNDTLVGGSGKDKLTGGTQADQFVFNAKLYSTNIDKIVDFVHGVDEIALDNAIFKALGTSFEKNEFVAKADGHAATKASQHVIYDKSDGTLWYDVDGRGGKVAVQFAQVGSEANHPMNLSWDDFAIV